MNIEKLPSGSYRVRKMINKKMYKVTFNHEPTEKEILLALSDKIEEVDTSGSIPFEVAAKEYCKLKKNVISPTTYREYSNTCSRLSERFKSIPIDKLTQTDIQQEINRLSALKKPKTVRNYHGFIVSVIKIYRPEFVASTRLPQKEVKEVYIPTDEDVRRLLEYSRNNCNGRYYIAIILACYGMRRSEICALEPSDIIDNVAYINKAKVMDSDKKWVVKNLTKTEKSTRQIPLPADIVQMINDQGYVYQGHPNNITGFINDACQKLGIPHFSIHKLRHYFCSRLSSENIDTETIMALGGWKTDYVMKTVYRHSVSDKVKDASDKLSGILFK